MSPRASSNVFYRYGIHYWDYQRWVSEDMMVNEFAGRAYVCAPCQGKDGIGEGGGACDFMFPIALADQCLVAGQGVLDQYGYRPGHLGRNVGILLDIVLGYRIVGWVALKGRM